jgi:hypothetical protein
MMGMLIFALGGFTVGLICGVCIGSGFIDGYWR